MTEKEPKAIMSCNLTGGESYLLINNTDSYYSRLENALNDIKADKHCSCDYLLFAFIALSSATLEYSLNYLLAVYCYQKHHYPYYKPYLESYTKISFKNKLTILPSIISEGKYVLQKEDNIILNLFSLIQLRNILLHNSQSVKVQKFDFPNLNVTFNEEGILIPEENINPDLTVDFQIEIKDNIIDILEKQQCIDLGESLLEFREYVVNPYLCNMELKENRLVKPI